MAWGLFEASGTLYQYPVPGHPDPQGRSGALGSKIIIGGPLPDAVACVMPDIPVQDSHIPRIQDKGPHIFCQGRLIPLAFATQRMTGSAAQNSASWVWSCFSMAFKT